MSLTWKGNLCNFENVSKKKNELFKFIHFQFHVTWLEKTKLTCDAEVCGVGEQLLGQSAPLLGDLTNGDSPRGPHAEYFKGEIAGAAGSGAHAARTLDVEDGLAVGVPDLVVRHPAGFSVGKKCLKLNFWFLMKISKPDRKNINHFEAA